MCVMIVGCDTRISARFLMLACTSFAVLVDVALWGGDKFCSASVRAKYIATAGVLRLVRRIG